MDREVNDVLLGAGGLGVASPKPPPLQIRALERELTIIAEALVRIANSHERSVRASEAMQKDIAAMRKLAEQSR